eukprot:m.11838 g.11838  ORF g.11838 m.11838 type:complete len:242 (+) comp7049_c0_seq1:75-800(+)
MDVVTHHCYTCNLTLLTMLFQYLFVFYFIYFYLLFIFVSLLLFPFTAFTQFPKQHQTKMATEKQIKAALKEGGKKGQDIAGLYDMGGISFYHISLEKCEGSMELVLKAMEGANKKVDEGADDRKGGAGHVGKMFLSSNNDQVAIACFVPKELQEKHEVTPKVWLEVFLSNFDGEIKEEGEELVTAVLPANKEKERFPVKMRDEAINLGFAFLVQKGLINDDDDDSDFGLDGDALEEAGIEW